MAVKRASKPIRTVTTNTSQTLARGLPSAQPKPPNQTPQDETMQYVWCAICGKDRVLPYKNVGAFMEKHLHENLPPRGRVEPRRAARRGKPAHTGSPRLPSTTRIKQKRR